MLTIYTAGKRGKSRMTVQSAVEITIKTQPVINNQNSMYQQDFSTVPEPMTGGRNYPYNVPNHRQQGGKSIVFMRLVGPSQPFTSYRGGGKVQYAL